MLRFLVLAGIALVIGGCGRQVQPGGEYTENSGPEVTVEAYLFDTRLDFEGKRRSVRLEIFATDSLIGLGGRAYLGKGALKGWLDGDSLKLYFPSSNDFVYEPMSDLLQSFKCGEESPSIGILSLFYNRPDGMKIDEHIEVVADTADEDRPTFTLLMADCPWKMVVVYDRRDPGWRIREFEFDNGDNLKISADRREYRSDTDVRSSKFQVTIPSDAARIIP